MKKYIIGFKSSQWKHCPTDYLIQDFKTKAEALTARENLKKMGYIQTFIKLKKGERALTDF